MRLDRNTTVAAAIAERVKQARIGVVVWGLAAIDPIQVINQLSLTTDKQLHIAIVGYDVDLPPAGNVVLKTDLESAVAWRSTPALAGNIIVFVREEVPKLHSLADLDRLSGRDISAYILGQAEQHLYDNEPQSNFWKALGQESAAFPLELIEAFVKQVQAGRDRMDAIPNNMWRLGLLRDDQILERAQSPRQRIIRNRELLVQMALLSEESRKRLSSVLARSTGPRRDRLRKAFTDLQLYYRTGSMEALSRLDISTVEDLIKAGKPVKEQKVPAVATPVVAPSMDPPTPEAPLKGRRLMEAVSEVVVAGTAEAEQGLRELAEALRHKVENPDESAEQVTLAAGFGGRTIALEVPPAELRSTIAHACTDGRWGGVLSTTRSTLKEALLYASPTDVTAYDPWNIAQGLFGNCLFTLLESFDRHLPEGATFKDCLKRFISAREELSKHVDLLLSHPFVLFGGYPELRKVLHDYLDAYTSILHLLRHHEPLLHANDAEALRFVISEILRLDVLYVQTPTEWKAMLTPLHPFHLWRYQEILAQTHSADEELTPEDREKLAAALPALPHLVHFIVVSPQVTQAQHAVLPQAGSIETLPTFENHTNRYVGNDGLEFLPDVLRRFVSMAPYSRAQLRIGVVDVPELKTVLGQLSEFIKTGKCDQVVLDAYFTRGQNPSADMGRLDYDSRDYELTDLLRSGKLLVRLQSFDSIQRVATELTNKPVHVAMLFDQAQYHIGYAPRAQQLIVSPLVITYQYDYSDTFGRGTIAPSSEAEDGLFSDFHFLIERAALMPAGQQLRLQYDQAANLEPVNSLLTHDAAKWLVVADRILSAYAPQQAVPLGERHFGQREVAVWAKSSERSVAQLVDLLRRFNLRPQPDTVADLIRTFGHIAAGGLLSLPGPGGHPDTRERQEKAFLGTVLAAAWYRRQYPSALVTSLDSNLARLWLRDRLDSDQRADLIGLRLDDTGTLIVEPIEVKTRADDAELIVEASADGRSACSGRAIDQLNSTLSALHPIFGGSDSQPLFTPARREVLKYQLHRECFRDIHDKSWQRHWYYTLKDAFSAQPLTTTRCSGLVIHMKLEENSAVRVDTYADQSLSLVTVGAQAIQELITPEVIPGKDNKVPPETNDYPTGSDATDRAAAVEGIAPYHGGNETSEHAGAGSTPDVGIKPSSIDSQPTVGPTELELHVEAEDLARQFRRACQSYRIQVDECDPSRAVAGPTVWRFYVRLGRGQRLDPLRAALEDIGREMRRTGLLVGTLPFSDDIAVDIPRSDRQTVPLARALATLPPSSTIESMPIPIGVTPEGVDIIRDLAKMPHLMVGGTTGAGKTRFLYGVLSALLQTHPDPSTLRLLVSSSKTEDFSFFEGLAHLETGEVVGDAAKAIQLLESFVTTTLDSRGRVLADSRCVNIGDYNHRNPGTPLAPLVVVVDEFADLVDQLGRNRTAKDTFYSNIRRVAQLGRSRGIHLVLCTQRPSADLVPTNIRNLMNARVALRVNDGTASRMILEETGAEQLQLHGDLLFKDPDGLLRAQGYFVETEELYDRLQTLPRGPRTTDR